MRTNLRILLLFHTMSTVLLETPQVLVQDNIFSSHFFGSITGPSATKQQQIKWIHIHSHTAAPRVPTTYYTDYSTDYCTASKQRTHAQASEWEEYLNRERCMELLLFASHSTSTTCDCKKFDESMYDLNYSYLFIQPGLKSWILHCIGICKTLHFIIAYGPFRNQ